MKNAQTGDLAGEVAPAPRTETSDHNEEVLRAVRGLASKREMAVFGYSRETKRLITRMIETNPAMEEAILKLADLAYFDGAESER